MTFPRIWAFVVVIVIVGSAAAATSLAGGSVLGTSSTSSASTTIQTTITTTVPSTTVYSSFDGTLMAEIRVGPIQPVCYVGGGSSPPPPYFASVEAVITSQSGQNTTLPVGWVYDGCDVTGSVQTSLGSGGYQLSLTSCPWTGCSRALPVSFTIAPNRTTTIAVSIDTGIR